MSVKGQIRPYDVSMHASLSGDLQTKGFNFYLDAKKMSRLQIEHLPIE
jgi:hypothetical protein